MDWKAIFLVRVKLGDLLSVDLKLIN